MCAAAVQTIAYARHIRRFHTPSGAQQQYPLQKWPRILQFLHLLLWSTVTTFREVFLLERLREYPPDTILSVYRNRCLLGSFGIFLYLPDALFK